MDQGPQEPIYSADRRWWWDGQRWQPTQPIRRRVLLPPTPDERRADLWVYGSIMAACTVAVGLFFLFWPALRRLLLGG